MRYIREREIYMPYKYTEKVELLKYEVILCT